MDDLAREIWQFYCSEVSRQCCLWGTGTSRRTYCDIVHLSRSLYLGTPDGRKAGEPLSNHICLLDQRDVSGPGAHIKSVTKLGLDRGFGTVYNMYFTNIDGRERMHQMVDLIDMYHRLGGHHLQINCQDKNVFIDAQHPEKYPSLLVRVAGYMAYFVESPKHVQK